MRLTARTLPWPEVRRFYEELAQDHGWPFEEMAKLVSYLEASPYAGALFPYTSHEVLHISRTSNPTIGDGDLQIEFNPSNRTFIFTYRQSPEEPQPWSRACEESEWKHTLHRILHKRLRWFHEG
jgi:hypothetical protein